MVTRPTREGDTEKVTQRRYNCRRRSQLQPEDPGKAQGLKRPDTTGDVRAGVTKTEALRPHILILLLWGQATTPSQHWYKTRDPQHLCAVNFLL